MLTLSLPHNKQNQRYNMKKIILYLLFLPFTVHSQSYTFTKSESIYTQLPIIERIVLSPDIAWENITKNADLGFDMNVFSVRTNYLSINFNTAQFLARMDSFTVAFSMAAFPNTNIIDKNFNKQNNPQKNAASTVSYFVTGETGNRIFKLEYNNVKFGTSEDKDSLFYQLWYNEIDQSIEMHFGPSNVSTTKEVLSAPGNTLPGFDCGIMLFDNKNQKIIEQLTLDGSIDNPKLILNKNGYLDNFPTNGTIYRFVRSTTGINSILQQEKQINFVYPNPVAQNITIINPFIDAQARVQIIDITGRIVQQTQFSNESTNIDLSTLENGLYFVRLNTKEQTQTMRIIKQQ